MKKNWKLLAFITAEFLVVFAVILIVLIVGNNAHTVTFDLNGGTLVSGDLVQEIKPGQSAIAPEIKKEGSYFVKWSESYSNVTKDKTVTAVWDYLTTSGVQVEFGSNFCLISGSYEEISGDVYIGTFFNGSPVLGIKDGAFSGRDNITGIYLSEGIISIGNSAFSSCKNLKTAVIPTSVNSFGSNVFLNCKSLEALTVPFIGNNVYDNVETAVRYLFGASSNTKIPESLKELTLTSDLPLSNGSFMDCENIEKITVAGNVQTIEEYAFAYCKNLKEINLPHSVKEIGKNAFLATGLERISIPDGVEELPDGCFANSEKLTTVNFGANVKSVSPTSFQNCPLLKEYAIPKENTFLEYKDGKLFVLNNEEYTQVETLSSEYLDEFKKYLVTYYNASGVFIGSEMVTVNNAPNPTLIGYLLTSDLFLNQEMTVVFDSVITGDTVLYGNFLRRPILKFDTLEIE